MESREPGSLADLRLQVGAALKSFPKNAITSLSGKVFAFDKPETWSFSKLDVVHGLSQINRFVGQSREPYSVLQHELWCGTVGFDTVAENLQMSRGTRIDAHRRLLLLSHDDSESLLGDVSSPLKSLVEMVFYRRLEEAVSEAMARQFGIGMPSIFDVELVHLVDRMAFLCETRDLRGGDDFPFLPRSVIKPLPAHVVRAKYMAEWIKNKELAR